MSLTTHKATLAPDPTSDTGAVAVLAVSGPAHADQALRFVALGDAPWLDVEGGIGNGTLSGALTSSGDATVASGSASNGATFTGVWALDGTVSGTWENSFEGISGTFTGQKS